MGCNRPEAAVALGQQAIPRGSRNCHRLADRALRIRLLLIGSVTAPNPALVSHTGERARVRSLEFLPLTSPH